MHDILRAVRRGRDFRFRHPALLLVAFLAVVACSDGVTGPGDDPDPDPPGTTYRHDRGPGESAADLLGSSDFDSLVVQVQFVEGNEPTADGLQHLADFLTARLNKPAGIEIRVEAPLPITPQATYTTAEIRALEQTHRTAYTEGSTLALHLLFLNGAYDAAANVLGIAYNNTSMAIFEGTIQANTGGALQPSRSTVEGTVAQHEVGHLMGLVANGSAMQVEHQDEPNGHHCDDPDCLMYYAVRTTDFLSNLLGGIPTLDQDCLDDLAANGGK